MNFNQARDTVLRAKKRSDRLMRAQLWVSVSAHIGSVATIAGVWYTRTGKGLEFDVSSRLDWVVGTILMVLLANGWALFHRMERNRANISLSREELSAWLYVAREDADASVISFAGDLSWLASDADALKSLKKQKPSLLMRIHYDNARVAPSVAVMVRELASIGIEFLPYRAEAVPRIRGMLVDGHSQERGQFHFMRYSRSHTARGKSPVSEITVTEYGAADAAVLRAVSALADAIVTTRPAPIKIGISGASNVGKSTLARLLKTKLESSALTVRIVLDRFRIVKTGTEPTSTEANYAILFDQVLQELDGTSDIVIFDQTLADHLCYFQLRASSENRLFDTLAQSVAEVIKAYDINIYVRPFNTAVLQKTTHLTPAQRRQIDRSLSRFFNHYLVDATEYKLEPSNFDDAVEILASRLASQIVSMHTKRRLGS